MGVDCTHDWGYCDDTSNPPECCAKLYPDDTFSTSANPDPIQIANAKSWKDIREGKDKKLKAIAYDIVYSGLMTPSSANRKQCIPKSFEASQWLGSNPKFYTDSEYDPTGKLPFRVTCMPLGAAEAAMHNLSTVGASIFAVLYASYM